jgi:predicted Zn-dependent peptidase
LSNGLPVWLIEAHAVPLVQINLLIKAGAGDDPAGKFGVASLTAAMLDEGAGSRTALQIADEAEFLGANLLTTSGFDASAVRLNVPVSRLRDGLALLADVALRPTFPGEELERVRKERLTALLQAKDDPASVAPLAFARTVFGAAHRYGTAAVGTESTITAFTVADLKAFHAAMYQPANATLIAIGDIQAADAMAQLEAHFGKWQNGAAAHLTSRTPASGSSDHDRRHSRGRSVADTHWRYRRRKVDARLLSDRGDEHRSRWIVHLAAESEPARGASVRLRCGIAVRHATHAGTGLCDRRCADGQDCRRAA